jgi:hypothetical protein
VGHLIGSTLCHFIPIHSDEPTTGADGAPSSDEAQTTYTTISEQYMFDLSDYEDWCDAEAHATQILLGSMKIEFVMDLTCLPSTQSCGPRGAARLGQM